MVSSYKPAGLVQVSLASLPLSVLYHMFGEAIWALNSFPLTISKNGKIGVNGVP